MYQISHTKPAEAAAQILMIITKEGGYWWVHADEDEGFRLVRLGTPLGDQLAKSGSPSLAGPFNRDMNLLMLTGELYKAQRAEFRTFITKANDIASLRDNVLDALEDQPLTIPQIAERCQENVINIRSSIYRLSRYGLVAKTGVAAPAPGGLMYYWRKVA